MKTLLNFFIFGSIRAQNLSPDDCKVSASCFSTISDCDLAFDSMEGKFCVTSLWKFVTFGGEPAVNVTIYSSSVFKSGGNWAGLGFSRADDMTIADLFICKRLGNATKLVSAYSSQNSRPTEYSNYTGIKAETVETSLVDPSGANGFWCSFTMTTNHTKMDNSNSSTIFIYNETSRYHAIEAYGQLTTWDLTFHDGTAVAKDVIPGFYINEKNKEYKAVVPQGTKLFKSHGTLMILAWGFFIPAGGLFAAARNLFQKEGLWFNLHRAFMIMGVLLNIAGFVVIFVEKGGFVDPGYALGYVHAVMGCLVLGYSLMNVIRGFLRPDLESPRRRRFKVTHFIFAGLAILLSNANITIGLCMESLSASAIAFGVLSGICMLFIPIFHFWLSSDDLPMPIHKLVLTGVFVVLIANTVSAATIFLLNA